MRNMYLFILYSLLVTKVFAATPAPPSLSLSVDRDTVHASWTHVDGATGFTLLYAPYPSASPISSIDMGTALNLSVSLPVGASYYVAVQAYNEDGASSYSNILNFEISVAATIGIEYSLIDNPDHHDDGLNYLLFDQGIIFDAGLGRFGPSVVADVKATQDGIYIVYVDINDSERFVHYTDIKGSGARQYIAKIPYEPVPDCKDWCYDRQLQGMIQDIEVNEINDGEFDAAVLYQRELDGRFYVHYLENGIEQEVAASKNSNGRWIGYDPDSLEYNNVIPLDFSITHQGVTSTLATNSIDNLLDKTVNADNLGPLWKELEILDGEHDNVGGELGDSVGALIGGQEAHYIIEDNTQVLYKYFGEGGSERIVFSHTDNGTILQVVPAGDDVYVVIAGMSEDDQGYYMIYKFSESIDTETEPVELLYRHNHTTENRDLTIAVSPSWIYMSNGRAINRETNRIARWLATPEQQESIQSYILPGGLLGASDDIALVWVMLPSGPRIARVTPLFRTP